MDGAAEKRRLQPVRADVERGFHRLAEAVRARPRAQVVIGARAYADRAARVLDARARGERGDEGQLPVGRPAVHARADGHGGEGSDLGVAVLGGLPVLPALCSVAHRTG